jgi:hypothetical protein
MADLAFSPYFSGNSFLLESVWNEAVRRSPWTEITAQGISIDWVKARDLNPKGAHSSPLTERHIETLQALCGFIPWTYFLEHQTPNLGSKSKHTISFYPDSEYSKHKAALEEFTSKAANWVSFANATFKANARYFRKKKYTGIFHEPDISALLAALHGEKKVEHQLQVTFDKSSWYPLIQCDGVTRSMHSLYGNPQMTDGSFATANKPLMALTDRVTSWLVDESQKRPRGRDVSTCDDLDRLFRQLGDCSTLMWRDRCPRLLINSELMSFIDGGRWDKSPIHKNVEFLLERNMEKAQIFRLETGDSKLIHEVQLLEKKYNTWTVKLNYSYQEYMREQKLTDLYHMGKDLDAEIRWLTSQTPLLAMLYSGIFQFYRKGALKQPIFGFTPLVMGLQCAKKLTGNSILSLHSEHAASAVDTPQETEESSSQEEGSTEEIPAAHAAFSGAQLWDKIYRAQRM